MKHYEVQERKLQRRSRRSERDTLRTCFTCSKETSLAKKIMSLYRKMQKWHVERFTTLRCSADRTIQTREREVHPFNRQTRLKGEIKRMRAFSVPSLMRANFLYWLFHFLSRIEEPGWPFVTITITITITRRALRSAGLLATLLNIGIFDCDCWLVLDAVAVHFISLR